MCTVYDPVKRLAQICPAAHQALKVFTDRLLHMGDRIRVRLPVV